MPPKIAVIEDDRDLSALLCYAFEQEGFEFSGTHDGAGAAEFCVREQPDAIVLDGMLPGMDGFSICQQLREDPRFRETPVIFLTAGTEETDRLRGLETGGDDYVVKPFSVRELTARVKLRLRGRSGLEKVHRLGTLELDIERREVRLGGISFPVTPTTARGTYEGDYQDFNTDIRNQRLRYIERTIMNSQVAGEHLFKAMGNSVMTWAMSYSSATRDEPDLRKSLQIYHPRTDQFIFFDDSQSAFRMFNDLDETILNPSFDMLVPFYKGTFSGAVKFGANFSSRARGFRSRRFKYVLRARGALTAPCFEVEDHWRPANRGRQPGCHDIQSVPARDRERAGAVQRC